MLGYPEVTTNLVFENIPTQPLELRAGVETRKKKSKQNRVQDGMDTSIEVDEVRKDCLLPERRQIRDPELIILQGLYDVNISVDKVTLFSVRPPELRVLFREVPNYYRWFKRENSQFSYEQVEEKIDYDLNRSVWINGLNGQVKLRLKAFNEVKAFVSKFDGDTAMSESPIGLMIQFINRIISIVERGQAQYDQLEDDDADDFVFYSNEFVYDDDEKFLPVPVLSYIRPTLVVQFILHILLSMGEFDTEVDLLHHNSLQNSLRYAKLIGESDNEDDLKRYSSNLLRKFIEEQLVFFPNSLRTLDSWIVAAGDLFDSVIVSNNIAITSMPSVLQSSLFETTDESVLKFWKDSRMNMCKSAMNELGDAVDHCSVPSVDNIINATKEAPLEWNVHKEFEKVKGNLMNRL